MKVVITRVMITKGSFMKQFVFIISLLLIQLNIAAATTKKFDKESEINLQAVLNVVFGMAA